MLKVLGVTGSFHTYIDTYTHMDIHTHIHTWIHTHIHTHMDTYTHRHMVIHTHIHTWIHTHTHTQVYTQIYTNTPNIHKYVHVVYTLNLLKAILCSKHFSHMLNNCGKFKISIALPFRKNHTHCHSYHDGKNLPLHL